MLDCQSYLNFLQCVGGIRVKKVMERLKKIFSNVLWFTACWGINTGGEFPVSDLDCHHQSIAVSLNKTKGQAGMI